MADQEFRVQEESRRDQLIAIGSILCFLAMIAVVLWARPQFRTLPGFGVAAAASAFLIWMLIREIQAFRVNRSWPVIIDEDGVHYASPGQIAWADIGGLETMRRHQRVDLLDKDGRLRVSIPFDLEDADEVIQFVADVLADRWPRMRLPHEFAEEMPKPIIAAATGFAAFLGLAIVLAHGRPEVQLLFAAAIVLFGAACAALWMRCLRRLTVGERELTIARGLRPREFDYADIETVGLRVVGEKADRRLDVRVTFRDNSATYVLPWQCDPFEVYATVKAAYEAFQASTAERAADPAAAG
jgi:hypothetical protein